MFDWKPLLDKISRAMLQEDAEDTEDTEDFHVSVGYVGASEAQIQAAETRLGVTLPPSYRQFLSVTNGWNRLDNFIEGLYPVEKIDWHKNLSEDLIDAWLESTEGMEDEIDTEVTYTDQPVYMIEHYLRDTLQISDYDDAVILLNPKVITAGGEWEAWLFADWIPGAERFPSFWALMENSLSGTQNLQAHEAKRYKEGDDLHAKLPFLIEELRRSAAIYAQTWSGSHMPLPFDMSGASKGIVEAAIQEIERMSKETSDSAELSAKLHTMAADYQKKYQKITPKAGLLTMFRLLININAANSMMEQHARKEAYRMVVVKLQWFLSDL